MLRNCPRWRSESGRSVFSLFLLCCGCVEGTRHVNARYWPGSVKEIAPSSFYRNSGGAAGIFLLFLLRCSSAACLQSRSICVKPRNHNFLEDIAGQWSDREWKQNFCLSRATFQFLCQQLRPRLERSHTVRRPLSHEQRVAICLWRLGTNVEY